MLTPAKLRFRRLAACIGAAGALTTGEASRAAETKPLAQQLSNGEAQQQQAPKAEPAQGDEEEPADEEPAPAALALDVSPDSPLIRELYQATRETKEEAILSYLGQAQKIVEGGADLKATDERGRTALHWAVFG